MNKETEKLVNELKQLKASNHFEIMSDCNRSEEDLFYNPSNFTVYLYFRKNIDYDKACELIAKAYTLIDKANKEYLHAINHPNPITALNSYLTINK